MTLCPFVLLFWETTYSHSAVHWDLFHSVIRRASKHTSTTKLCAKPPKLHKHISRLSMRLYNGVKHICFDPLQFSTVLFQLTMVYQEGTSRALHDASVAIDGLIPVFFFFLCVCGSNKKRNSVEFRFFVMRKLPPAPKPTASDSGGGAGNGAKLPKLQKGNWASDSTSSGSSGWLSKISLPKLPSIFGGRKTDRPA